MSLRLYERKEIQITSSSFASIIESDKKNHSCIFILINYFYFVLRLSSYYYVIGKLSEQAKGCLQAPIYRYQNRYIDQYTFKIYLFNVTKLHESLLFLYLYLSVGNIHGNKQIT